MDLDHVDADDSLGDGSDRRAVIQRAAADRTRLSLTVADMGIAS
jgi:hypothetical protein